MSELIATTRDPSEAMALSRLDSLRYASRTVLTVTALMVSGCAATASYPGSWSSILTTQDCAVLTGRYDNRASGVFPPQAEPPTLTAVFSALEARHARRNQLDGMLAQSTTVQSVNLRAQQDSLIAIFATSKAENYQLNFTRYFPGHNLEYLVSAAFEPSETTRMMQSAYICPSGFGLLTFLIEPDGTPSSALKPPAEARISLFKATDGSLVVRWAMASNALLGYDSDVWLRYQPVPQ